MQAELFLKSSPILESQWSLLYYVNDLSFFYFVFGLFQLQHNNVQQKPQMNVESNCANIKENTAMFS